MSVFEYYRMGIPLIMPSLDLLTSWHMKSRVGTPLSPLSALYSPTLTPFRPPSLPLTGPLPLFLGPSIQLLSVPGLVPSMIVSLNDPTSPVTLKLW